MTNHLLNTDKIFFDKTDMDQCRVEKIVSDNLAGADDGELYLQYTQSESLVWDDQKLKSTNFDTDQGFGMRSVAGETFGFAHASEFSEAAIKRAGQTVQMAQKGYNGKFALPPLGTNQQLYCDDNPIVLMPFETKVKLLAEIDQYARSKDPRITQVSVNLAGSWSAIQIISGDQHRSADIRPMVRLNVVVYMEEKGRMESGSNGGGGRITYETLMNPETWKSYVEEAIRLADINLSSIPAPAGEMVVVLGSGWPGVLLHEAIGHGLEGDFNRKKTSAFAGLLGERVAAPGITVVDDGTLKDRRGSLTIDDEGTPSQRTVLIEDGILVGYMQDRMNARLMGMEATGNGRRQNYAHNPIPRMTNTFMENGSLDPAEIIQSVKKGLYAPGFGGGQVDITNGKFVFDASEAYLIEDGKIGAPVKGATLIGNGPDILTKVSMVGSDLALDPGIGTCGKAGQGVPVGLGQPTLKIDSITVGGTDAR